MALNINTGFDVHGTDPIDDRLVVNGRTGSDLDNVAYVGLIVYDTAVSGDDKLYVLDALPHTTASNWRNITGGGGGSDTNVPDLPSTVTDGTRYSIIGGSGNGPDDATWSSFTPGTVVDANPSGTDGANLTRIAVGGTNYNIPSGGTPSDTYLPAEWLNPFVDTSETDDAYEFSWINDVTPVAGEIEYDPDNNGQQTLTIRFGTGSNNPQGADPNLTTNGIERITNGARIAIVNIASSGGARSIGYYPILSWDVENDGSGVDAISIDIGEYAPSVNQAISNASQTDVKSLLVDNTDKWQFFLTLVGGELADSSGDSNVPDLPSSPANNSNYIIETDSTGEFTWQDHGVSRTRDNTFEGDNRFAGNVTIGDESDTNTTLTIEDSTTTNIEGSVNFTNQGEGHSYITVSDASHNDTTTQRYITFRGTSSNDQYGSMEFDLKGTGQGRLGEFRFNTRNGVDGSENTPLDVRGDRGGTTFVRGGTVDINNLGDTNTVTEFIMSRNETLSNSNLSRFHFDIDARTEGTSDGTFFADKVWSILRTQPHSANASGAQGRFVMGLAANDENALTRDRKCTSEITEDCDGAGEFMRVYGTNSTYDNVRHSSDVNAWHMSQFDATSITLKSIQDLSYSASTDADSGIEGLVINQTGVMRKTKPPVQSLGFDYVADDEFSAMTGRATSSNRSKYFWKYDPEQTHNSNDYHTRFNVVTDDTHNFNNSRELNLDDYFGGATLGVAGYSNKSSIGPWVDIARYHGDNTSNGRGPGLRFIQGQFDTSSESDELRDWTMGSIWTYAEKMDDEDQTHAHGSLIFGVKVEDAPLASGGADGTYTAYSIDGSNFDSANRQISHSFFVQDGDVLGLKINRNSTVFTNNTIPACDSSSDVLGAICRYGSADGNGYVSLRMRTATS